jgi:hypothetical protein
MSDYAGSDADRDAFFAELGRVFEEFRQVSRGYAICHLTRLAQMVGGDIEKQAGITRAENERIIIEFSELPLPPGVTEGECIAFVPRIGPDGNPELECLTYLTH